MDLIAAIDWNRLLEPPNGILIICGAVAAVGLLAPQWRRMRQHADDARLKEQMVQRGFTADEIERVMRAGDEATHAPSHRRAAHHAGAIPDDI